MRPVLALVVGLLALSLGGCGWDLYQDDDVTPQRDTVRAGLVELYAGPGATPAATTEGGCFADALLDRVSLDDLVDAEVVQDDGEVVASLPILEPDVAGAWVDAMGSCTSYAEAAARGDRIDALDTDDYVACLDRAVPAEQQRAALVATLTGAYSTDPTATGLTAAQQTCAARVRATD